MIDMAMMPQRVQTSILEARRELASKTKKQIEWETALKWCGRACVAWDLGLHADAREYAHEALEHAAVHGDLALLNVVRQALVACQIPF
jgi:hypothetical protein